MRVIYQSKNGKTRKLAEAIAEAAGHIECNDLEHGYDVSKIAEGELIFLGSGVYGGKSGDKVITFVRELKKSKKKVRLALFGSSNGKGKAVKALRKITTKNGFNPIGEDYNCPGKFLFFHPSRPNQADINAARNYAERMTKN